MIQPIAAPKVVYPRWIALPYTYAAVLVILAALTLMGIGGFDFAGIVYETPGTPELAIAVAALEVYSLPFVLRLPLSRLARFLSATFSVLLPLFLMATWAWLHLQGVVRLHLLAVLAMGLLAGLGLASFIILGGPKALQLREPRTARPTKRAGKK